MNLSEYILLPREQRIAHIDLSSDCTLGPPKRTEKARRALIKHLSINEDVKQRNIQCCHLCPNNSKAAQHCFNPLHMYIGTRKENEQDKPRQARTNAAKKARAASLALSTPEERSERARKAAQAKLNRYTPQELSLQSQRGASRLTPEQRSERSRKANASLTPEQRSERTRKINNNQTPEERSERQRRAAETRRRNKESHANA
jgi:hypothetical protein